MGLVSIDRKPTARVPAMLTFGALPLFGSPSPVAVSGQALPRKGGILLCRKSPAFAESTRGERLNC